MKKRSDILKTFNKKFQWLFVFVIFFVASCHLSNENRSLNDVLNYYGFVEEGQKNALKELSREASIAHDGTSLDDFFSKNRSNKQIVAGIIKFVKETQKKFTIRRGYQERWEVRPSNWMTKNHGKIFMNLKILGFIDAIYPSENTVNAICILGSTRKNMADRIKFAEFLVNRGLKTDNVILLSGERYVTAGVDGSESELSKIAAKFKIIDWKKLTETHLMKDLFSASSLRKDFVPIVIDTPAGNLPRPTTQTTILQLIQWLQSKGSIKKIIFVSSQPHIKYQKAVIETVFSQKSINIPFEVVGAAVPENMDVQPIIGGLGSYIWAASPTIISKMNISKEMDKETKQSYDVLYPSK